MSVPYTRTLGYVLRDQINRSVGLRRFIAPVAGIPDDRHVTIDQDGAEVTIPRLRSYWPVTGEGAFCVTDTASIVAIGSLASTANEGGGHAGYVTLIANSAVAHAQAGAGVVFPATSFPAHGARVFVEFMCSGVAATAGHYAFYPYLDGAQVTQLASGVGDPQSHAYLQAQVRTLFSWAVIDLGVLTVGNHTIAIVASTALVTDANDRVTIVIREP